jgi:hypothetical protein
MISPPFKPLFIHTQYVSYPPGFVRDYPPFLLSTIIPNITLKGYGENCMERPLFIAGKCGGIDGILRERA